MKQLLMKIFYSFHISYLRYDKETNRIEGSIDGKNWSPINFKSPTSEKIEE